MLVNDPFYGCFFRIRDLCCSRILTRAMKIVWSFFFMVCKTRIGDDNLAVLHLHS